MAWAAVLRYRADRCDTMHPDAARTFRGAADIIVSEVSKTRKDYA